jgi:hypothetical protein
MYSHTQSNSTRNSSNKIIKNFVRVESKTFQKQDNNIIKINNNNNNYNKEKENKIILKGTPPIKYDQQSPNVIILENKTMTTKSSINKIKLFKTTNKSKDDNKENINNENIQNANLNLVKISHKSFGIIQGYAAITTEGKVRDYNEDRVTIIFNISKPTDCKENYWPKCSFFGLYDGHGGSACADFLRNNLHKYVKVS